MNDTYCKRSKYELVLRATDHNIQALLCCKSQHPVDLIQKEKLEQIKKDLANGVRNHHCTVCWKAEDAGQVSWRQIGNDIGFHIKSVEIYFDNICDQACIYCNSKYSSKWAQEIKNAKNNDLLLLESLGYNVSFYPSIKFDYKNTILNEIKEIAKKSSHTETVNILLLGGEPLITRAFKQKNVLKELVENFYSTANEQTTLILTIFTNGNTPNEIIDQMISISNTLKEKYLNLKINVQISVESTYSNAEFVRYGLDYDQFLKNYVKYLKNNIYVGFCMTVNTVTLIDSENFLKSMFDIAKQNNKKIFFNFNLLNYPEFLSINTLPEEYQTIIKQCRKIVIENRNMFVDEIFYNRMLTQLDHAEQTLGTDISIEHNLKAQQYFSYLKKTRNLDLKDINLDLHNFLLDNTA